MEALAFSSSSSPAAAAAAAAVFSPGTSPSSSSSSFSFSFSSHSSPPFSPRSPFPPLSPMSSFSSPLFPSTPRSIPSSPRTPSFSLSSSFKGSSSPLDCPWGSSPLLFEGFLHTPLKKEKQQKMGHSGISVAAYAGCATEQKENFAKSRVGTIRKTHYTMLGVSPHASVKEIRLAYRRLALLHHPDVSPLHQLDTATKLFSEINEAYATLSDPQKRACYDLKLALESPTGMSVPISSSPRKYTDTATGRVYPSMNSFYREWKGTRNWETDQCWS